MKLPSRIRTALIILFTLALPFGWPLQAAPLGSTFNYQGRLTYNGAPANGIYDLRFAVFDSTNLPGTQIAGPITNSATAVTNGLFTVPLDFGPSAFDGSSRWLEIAVRTNGGAAFTSLNPREPLSAAPYALFAPNAGSAATAVTANSVANNAVSGAAIATGQVVKSLNGLQDAVALAAGANVSFATNANTLTIAATGGGASTGWSTNGNAGTSPANNFIGTTDGQPLVIKASRVGINTNNPQATLQVNGTLLAASFTGDGSGLTNVPAALATPFTLNPLAVTNNGGASLGIAISGRYAYLASGYDGLRVYDLSDSAHPLNIAHDTAFGWDVAAVALSGHIAFVASDKLYCVDVSSPANPVALGSSTGNYYGAGVALSGTIAYVAASGDGLFTYNVSNPASPTSLGHIDNGGSALGVSVSGNFAYLANDTDGLRIYNVANPAAPVAISRIYNAGARVRGVAVSGSFAYIANDSDGLRIYNISNPTNPVSISQVSPAGYAYGVAISGNYAFVANYSDGLRVYDVSDPAHPKSVGVASPAGGDNSPVAVAVAGNYAYTAGGLGGLSVFFAAPLATVPGVVGATGFLGDGSSLSNLNAGQLTGQIPTALLGNVWQLGGNAGTKAGSFLGTTDNQPLELRVQNQPALRLGTNGSLALGQSSVASAPGAVALGNHTTASGTNALAMGAYNIASGGYSTTLGRGNSADGEESFAMGLSTVASGLYSTALGYESTADGYASVAMGALNFASGTLSFALGQRAKANHEGTFVWADDYGSEDFASTEDFQFLIRAHGGVGIGVNDPTAMLHVSGAIGGSNFFPIAIAGESHEPFGIGVLGRGYDGGDGVMGFSDANHGVFGVTSNGSGVYGVSQTVDGIGVYGESKGTGVYGSSTGESSFLTAGVVGIGGGSYGVIALSASNAAVAAAHDLFGPTMTSANLAGPVYAGEFWGEVAVNGNLSKSSGSFKIDHPLDPSNKYLSHSFVESPDMKNIYDGVATLDDNGEAVVELPEWFEALNKDFRYQLTAIGAPGPNLHIAKKISRNRFTVAGGVAGLEVSWQVTGTRQDAWANAHRIPVEEVKPASEQGTYLHPEVFGKPREEGANWAKRTKLIESQKSRQTLRQALNPLGDNP